ncbi:hypothetical protein KYB31_09330 [Clostridium felsineum]|uniref:hypothetical protein n=1 Tax=Clostridium felsineum TaxID=36839 RepID=UPI00214D55DF|nr:hypothetical protein [Clostridium felsineum]MCR3759190.1 hypothetical protein [Clostridium felsineum]
MNIERRYKCISKSKLTKKNFITRILCKHELVDDILTSDEGFSWLGGDTHIVHCKKCGFIKGYYTKQYK